MTDTGARVGTVAVLGGTGFLGAALTRHLVEHGQDVVTVARRVPPEDGGPNPVTDRIRAMDLADAPVPAIADLFARERVTAVVNAAGGMWGLTEPEMVAANSTLVGKVIDAIAQLPSRPRLVQIGSVHEYGVVPVGTDIAEDTPPHPVQAYGEEKLHCTEAVTAASAAGRIDGVTLRVANVVGAGAPPQSLLGGAADRLATGGRDGGPVRLELGPLGAQRDFVGLTDTVRAFESALTVPAIAAPVINVGRGVATSAREMVHTLIAVSGVPAEVAEAPAAGEPDGTWQRLRIDLAAEVLGWSPRAYLRDDLADLWAGAEAAAAEAATA
jgi:dTDP-6-deoxy-L-talose 4-dehydrogenase [NAD(P)+]